MITSLKTNSMLVAECVLNHVMIRGLDSYDLVYSEMFSNGREQGYTLIITPPEGRTIRVSFAEYRSSDEVVVYTWNNDFSLAKTKLFYPCVYSEVVEYINSQLNK